MAAQSLTLSQIAARVLAHPRPEITVISEEWAFPLAYEIPLIEAVEMARRNGVVMVYTPRERNGMLVWYKIVLKGKTQLVAWLALELQAIANGLRD